MTRRGSPRYDAASRAFHWLTAVLVIVAFVLGPEHFGRLMRQGLDPATRSDIVWHESLGLAVFVLTALRLVWVARRPTPPQFAMPAWLRRTSGFVHLTLWLALLLLPVTAMLALGGEAHPLTLLGGMRVDRMPLIAQSSFAGIVDWGDVHEFLGDAIVCIAGLHAVAALYHHVVLKDGVLSSMLPSRADETAEQPSAQLPD